MCVQLRLHLDSVKKKKKQRKNENKCHFYTILYVGSYCSKGMQKKFHPTVYIEAEPPLACSQVIPQWT